MWKVGLGGILALAAAAGLGFLGHRLFKTQAPKVQEVSTKYIVSFLRLKFDLHGQGRGRAGLPGTLLLQDAGAQGARGEDNVLFGPVACT